MNSLAARCTRVVGLRQSLVRFNSRGEDQWPKNIELLAVVTTIAMSVLIGSNSAEACPKGKDCTPHWRKVLLARIESLSKTGWYGPATSFFVELSRAPLREITERNVEGHIQQIKPQLDAKGISVVMSSDFFSGQPMILVTTSR
jgi:hypothetical protein